MGGHGQQLALVGGHSVRTTTLQGIFMPMTVGLRRHLHTVSTELMTCWADGVHANAVRRWRAGEE